MGLTLDNHISLVPFIGPAYAKRLAKLNIHTVSDLLYHIPSRYDDFSQISKIKDLRDGEIVTIHAKIIKIDNVYTRGHFILQKAIIEDDTGKLPVVWFNQRFLTRILHANDQVSLSGKISQHQMESPQYEINSSIHTGRFVPIYPETAGITSKWLRSRVWFLLHHLQFPDYENSHTISLAEALNQIHFPDNLAVATLARKRLAFDELLFANLQAKIRKELLVHQTVGHRFTNLGAKISFPFKLTKAQERVTAEILADLQKSVPMNRLLQGDVGSGKTVVAAQAMQVASLNGYQSILMAPTEILANQHFATLKTLGLDVGLATGSQKKSLKSNILVGTHALLNDKIAVDRLGLVVIDEQHRFGVSQRSALMAKGVNPHVLTMTATPIPRTVALTLFGDLDISILDEMPQNRLSIKTWVVPPEKRPAAYEWIKKQKTQAFIICPFIEPSETLTTVKSAKLEFEKIKTIFPKLKIGLLHGKLKSKEKDLVLAGFKNKKFDILVTTPVVEVGIDIPGATIMVIEGADRFGLASLHPLRGRVGRGSVQSYCLLFGENSSRLKHLETTHSGLALAEFDLKIRGPGQRFGTTQHGHWDLKIADFSDLELIEKTNLHAQQVLANPQKFPLLMKMLKASTINSASN